MSTIWDSFLLGLDLRKPFIQAALICVGTLLIMLFLWVLSPSEEASWMAGASGMLLFTIVNTVNSLFRSSWIRYTSKSLGIFFIMGILLFILAGLLSQKGFGTPNVYHGIYVLFFVFYLMVSMLAGLIKQIIGFLEEIE